MNLDDSLRQAIIQRTRHWVRENFLYMRPDLPLEDATPLLDGIIDSVGVIELVAWLEATFHLAIPEPEITEAHLGTLGDIGAYLLSRLAINAPPGVLSSRQIA